MTTTFEAQLETRLEILTVIVNHRFKYGTLIYTISHSQPPQTLDQILSFATNSVSLFFHASSSIFIWIDSHQYQLYILFGKGRHINTITAGIKFISWTHAKNVDIYIYIVRSYLYVPPPDLSTLRQTI